MEHIKSAIYAPVVERQSRATRVWKAYHRMIVTLIATTSPPWLLFSSLFSLLNVLGMDAVWPRLVLTCFPTIPVNPRENDYYAYNRLLNILFPAGGPFIVGP